MKLDTDKEGQAAIFKAWQVPLIDELFLRTLTSAEAHTYLKERDIRTEQKGRETVSRASIINFLNNMVDQRLLEYNAESGKGGYHRIYKMILTREEAAHKIMGLFVNKLLETFPEESKTFPWPKS